MARIGQSKAALREIEWTRKGLTERRRVRGPAGRPQPQPGPRDPALPGEERRTGPRGRPHRGAQLRRRAGHQPGRLDGPGRP
ncbi:MAG: hypothetical protein MZV63_64870 [Marinilabiliales bacterium]|nr:hypothetical protein [Marinilabiliales bacterium]